jgi:hypothetical protein
VEREIGRDRVHEVPSHPRRRLRGFSEMKYCNDASGVLYLFRRGRICQYQSLCIYIDVRHSLSKHRLRSMVCVRTLYQQLHVEGPNHTKEWDDCSYNSRLSIIRIPELSSKAQGLFLHLELKRIPSSFPSSVFSLSFVHRSIAPLPPSVVEA